MNNNAAAVTDRDIVNQGLQLVNDHPQLTMGFLMAGVTIYAVRNYRNSQTARQVADTVAQTFPGPYAMVVTGTVVFRRFFHQSAPLPVGPQFLSE